MLEAYLLSSSEPVVGTPYPSDFMLPVRRKSRWDSFDSQVDSFQ